MTRTRHHSAWRSRLARLLSTLSVAALALVGVIVGATPAQAAPVITDPAVGASCYFNFLRIESSGYAKLGVGDSIEGSLVVDGQTYRTETKTRPTASDDDYFPLDFGGPWLDDDNTHTVEIVVNGTTVASGSFSYLTSCNPQPVEATATFGDPICTDSTATAPVDITTREGETLNFTVTAESADGTTTYTDRPAGESGKVHFDIPLATEGATTLSIVQHYRPTLTAPVDEHVYTLPEDCNTPSPSPTPTPTPTSTPEPTSTPTPEPTDTASPSPTASASASSVSLSAGTVTRGSQLTVSASSFAANEPVEIWLHSTPVKLLSTTASADGTVSATVTIPSETEIGAHKIEVRGTTSGSVYAALTVIDGLAVTGFDTTATTPAGIGASMLLLGGIVVVLIARRRAKTGS
ncbi:hypothetical protein [Microbacterium sp. T32]|uniref:hypothetical protein n=1 Tax=Microbacterium sp. T32 TaxID=1776083 RepID=UPI000A814658|nr:hypothetical protein [Microbacterium sp. T32]